MMTFRDTKPVLNNMKHQVWTTRNVVSGISLLHVHERFGVAVTESTNLTAIGYNILLDF